jgi:hemolysin III
MGWTVVFFLPLFLSNASPLFMLLIAAGGVLYTVGAAIYAKKGFKYHHLVWHLFIDLAAASHFVAIVFFL